MKDRNIKFVELFLRLAEQLETADLRRAGGYGFCIIDETMTPKEAAAEYAKTLRAIPGMMEPNFKIDF